MIGTVYICSIQYVNMLQYYTDTVHVPIGRLIDSYSMVENGRLHVFHTSPVEDIFHQQVINP